MSEVSSPFPVPDNAWFNGQVASWESSRFGYRALFEVIADPANFKEVFNSGGDDEIVELHEPAPGHRLWLTFLNDDGEPKDELPYLLDADNPTIILPKGTKFEMDATESTTSNLAYTCLIYGQKPRV